MLSRILESEVMDTRDEAVEYNSMDHSQVNRAFVDDFFAALNSVDRPAAPPSGNSDDSTAATRPLDVLDVGTGTAQIPIAVCRRSCSVRVTAVDLADEMIKLASLNVVEAGFEDLITLKQIDAKQMPFSADTFDAVISNSIVHHIPEPKQVLDEMLRVLRPGGLLFVRDLMRPADIETVDRLVAAYAGNANPFQQQMFRDSLCAALTLEEVRQILHSFEIPTTWANQTTDRHWTIAGAVCGQCG